MLPKHDFGDACYRMLRKSTTTNGRRQDKNRYWSDMALRTKMATRLSDIRKMFRLLHKAVENGQ